MPYVRYNLITFDSEKRDAMMPVFIGALDKATEITGPGMLRAVRVHFDTAQGADTFGSDGNRLMLIGFYDDKQTAEAARERVKADFSTLSEFVVGEPIVREGEIIWSFDADGAPSGSQVIPGYMRHTVVGIDPSKLDAIVAYADSAVGVVKSISGLRRIRIAAVKSTPPFKSEDRMIVSTAFDSKEASDASSEQTASIWSGFAEFMAEDPERRFVAGDLIYAYNR
ncbi:uncharacterized protein METZ01_LOCUS317381 [marine metagenome]|uniref:Uncharacterized protein n=1 Tax=marine metagenome TaxID=408172 RepID=A0A382NVS3_9ZZZZ